MRFFSLALFCHAFIATPSFQGSSFSDLVRLVAKSRAKMSPPLFVPNISLVVSQFFIITSFQMLILCVHQLFYHFLSNFDYLISKPQICFLTITFSRQFLL